LGINALINNKNKLIMNYKIYTCYHDDKLIKNHNLINDEYHILYPTHKKTNEIDLNYLHDVLS